jgi:hypothetical protein
MADTRDGVCESGHHTPIVGVHHWNPWGEPDFEATAPLVCGTCGKPVRLLSKEEQAQRIASLLVMRHGVRVVRR